MLVICLPFSKEGALFASSNKFLQGRKCYPHVVEKQRCSSEVSWLAHGCDPSDSLPSAVFSLLGMSSPKVSRDEPGESNWEQAGLAG